MTNKGLTSPKSNTRVIRFKRQVHQMLQQLEQRCREQQLSNQMILQTYIDNQRADSEDRSSVGSYHSDKSLVDQSNILETMVGISPQKIHATKPQKPISQSLLTYQSNQHSSKPNPN